MIRQVDEFREKLLGPGVPPAEALGFINGWIIKHIMETDSRIGIFAKNRYPSHTTTTQQETTPMTQLEWTDVLAIGLPAIDKQHTRLFAISNDLLNAIAQDEGKSALKEIFDQLKDYTQYHFKAEEAYMEKIGYPELSSHAAEHALLLVRVNTLWRLLQNGELISPEGVSLFINDWIVEHIMEKDVLIGKYAKSNA